MVLSQNICCPTCFGWSYPSSGHPYTKNSGCWYVKYVSLKSMFMITVNFIHKYLSVSSSDYVTIQTVFNNF